MSNYFSLVCIDCDDEMCFDLNHGDVVLTELAAKGPWAASQKEALDRFDFARADYQDVRGSLCRVDMHWLCTHGNHRLAVRSEYGYFATQCGEWKLASKRAPGESPWCVADKGHVGDHVFKK
jgi:hypothetical protein